MHFLIRIVNENAFFSPAARVNMECLTEKCNRQKDQRQKFTTDTTSSTSYETKHDYSFQKLMGKHF
jgi:hypothetical protein